MFRDVAYITKDFSVRAQDGWLLFRYWKKYVKRSVSEGRDLYVHKSFIYKFKVDFMRSLTLTTDYCNEVVMLSGH